MTWRVRPERGDDADLAAIAAVVNEVTPEDPTSVEELRWQDATYPGTRFVAEADGKIVGMATTGRIFMYPPGYERYWVGIKVLAGYRRRGIGSGLYAAASEYARAAGKTGFHTSLSERQADGIAFLEHRGFSELDRARMVQHELAGLERPAVEPPAGIELTTLAARPELVAGVHTVAELAFADIPHADEPIAAGPLDEFRARDVDRPGIPHDAFFVAVDEASGDVVGYASLLLLPGRRDMAWHDMTAVHPAFRGRGLAKTMKRATIAWAIDAGLTVLETGNDVDNAAMRAVNAALGYQPIPDEITFRGPLAGAGATGR